jgi:hypothetical protein
MCYELVGRVMIMRQVTTSVPDEAAAVSSDRATEGIRDKSGRPERNSMPTQTDSGQRARANGMWPVGDLHGATACILFFLLCISISFFIFLKDHIAY